MRKFVIIIGAAKSGTSTLFNKLGEHNRINTSAGKEPHYFCDGFYEDFLERDVRYEDLWEKPKGDVYLEASTGYTKFPVISGPVKNMKEYGISPRFIYIVREPIERMKSHVKYMMWRNENIKVNYLREICVVTSMYFKQIKRYEKEFGRESMILVMLEDMSSDMKRCVKNIFEFIGVDPVKVDSGDKKNETREVTNFELALRGTPLWKLKSFFPNNLKSQIRGLWSYFSESPEDEVIAGVDQSKIREMCDDALRLEELFDLNLDPWRESIATSELFSGRLPE